MNEHEQPAQPVWSGPPAPDQWTSAAATPVEPADDEPDDDLDDDDADELTAEEQELAERARRQRRRRKWTITLVVTALLLTGLVVFRNAYVDWASKRTYAAREADRQRRATMGSFPDAKKVLDEHAAALLRGDEQGWLAAVDPNQPDLREYYQRLYNGLRAMDVTGWDYYVSSQRPYEQYGTTQLMLSFEVAYCLAAADCPHEDPRSDSSTLMVAGISQDISLDKVDGVYRIVAVGQGQLRKPAPWQNTKLTFARGERVVVAAPDSQTVRLAEAVAAADQAAAAADRFTGHTGHKPVRYRVYLAGDDEWKAWGERPSWSGGYATPTGMQGTDVVVHMSNYPTQESLANVLTHEMGHVVTLSDSNRIGDSFFDVHGWLYEGVAEYIAEGRALQPGRLAQLRQAGNVPTHLPLTPLEDTATDEQVAALYGYGHLAVICMADRYGEDKMMRFVTRVARENSTYDDAARDAFGRPFADVSNTCTAYIRDVVR
jgi:hypothetical protein